MENLCDDLMYILFAVYQKAPHVLVTNKNINDMFDVKIDGCYYFTKDYDDHVNTYYRKYKKLCSGKFRGLRPCFFCKTRKNEKVSLAITQNMSVLKYVPKILRTPLLNVAHNLQFVPKIIKTPEINFPLAAQYFQFVPDILRTSNPDSDNFEFI